MNLRVTNISQRSGARSKNWTDRISRENTRNNMVYSSRFKRIIDVSLAVVATLILLPIGAIISIFVLFASGNPIFFSQHRLGLNGSVFRLYKFRTMYTKQSHTSTITVSGDERITRIGQFLRASKLDELPQLIHVIRGQMSFVGPRPDIPRYKDLIPEHFKEVLTLRPGITGPATIAFRYEEDLLAQTDDPVAYNDSVVFPVKLRINMEYAQNMGLLIDIKCLLATAFPAIASALGFDVFHTKDQIDQEFDLHFDSVSE